MSTTPEHDVTPTLVENLHHPAASDGDAIYSAQNTPISRGDNRGDAKRIEAWQWRPGQSGNPGGRPKGLIGASLHDYLTRNKGVKLEEMVKGAIESAIKGNPKALAVIRDSVDGRPAQSIDINANVTMTLADRLEAARKAIKEGEGE